MCVCVSSSFKFKLVACFDDGQDVEMVVVDVDTNEEMYDELDYYSVSLSSPRE